LKLILGGPGCGKTTRLLRVVEEELENGVRSDEIAFVTFTRAAANEARDRAAMNFDLDPEIDMPWFRTIHSLAYRALDMTREEVMSRDDWREFSALIGEPISGTESSFEASTNSRLGDKLLRVVDYASTTQQSLKDAWNEVGDETAWRDVEQFEAALREFKTSIAKLGFTDMLISYINEGEPVPVKVAVVDEAQDLTAAQWKVVERAFANVERLYIGGDDDQAIYRWAGADVNHFLHLSTGADREILELSHRLPRSVFEVGQRIVTQISNRYEKPYRPSDRDGVVDHHMHLEYAPLRNQSGSWLLLARNGYLLSQLEEVLRARGLPYARRTGPVASERELDSIGLWDALQKGRISSLTASEARALYKTLGRPRPALKELTQYGPQELELDLTKPWTYAMAGGITPWRIDYYTECMNRGESLRVDPRFRVETIHGVKGAQADNVLLLLDYSRRTANGFNVNPDHEHRVFYVGVTRAYHSLHIVRPQTYNSYPGLSR
jgi:DNA helicase-2/ATP-dependent DNA helicase PcrA